jgi:uncharacterized protein (DUF736 family)
MKKNSALIIGSFQSTETGYTGKLDTLAIQTPVQFLRIEDKEKDTHPDYTVSSGRHRAWRFRVRADRARIRSRARAKRV